MKCEHDLAEKETACYADSLCPICLNAKLHTLKDAIEKFKNHMDEYLVDQDIDPAFQELYKSVEEI